MTSEKLYVSFAKEPYKRTSDFRSHLASTFLLYKISFEMTSENQKEKLYLSRRRMRLHDLLLPHTATHYNTQQHTTTHCNTLQHATTHCNTLQHTVTPT